MVQRVEIFLEKSIMGDILDVPIDGIRFMKNQCSFLEFVKEAPRVVEKSKAEEGRYPLRGALIVIQISE